MRRFPVPPLVLIVVTLTLAAAAASLGARDTQKEAQPPAARGTEVGAPPEAALDLAAPAPGARSARNASYSIDVALDRARRMLRGREILTWRNISRVATSELRFHLYYNAWKNTASTWLREAFRSGPRRIPRALPAADLGWIDISAIRLIPGTAPPVDLASGLRFVAPDDGNADDQTVMSVALPSPVASGETVTVEIEWTSQIPRTFSRTGGVGNFYFLGQWFPKIGVLEDTGWNCHQFHAGTEFYADYGVYDVRMTVPKGWVVGATGTERSRREANGATTHEYYQEDVHDFAWTTSPDYLEQHARFEHPDLPAVDMRLLLQPEHAGLAARYFEATKAALRYYGEWFGAYPYGHITVIDPAWQSGAGGMEYPTLFTGGARWLAPSGVASPEGVTVHECGHQFWYAMVGNNEFEHAWLDEGLNTFSTGRTVDQVFKPNYRSLRFFGDFIPYVLRDIVISRETGENRLDSYRQAAKSDVPATPSYRYWPATGSVISYDKTALWLHTLERYLGWPTLQKILSTFFEQWKFRHPKPDDFFAVVNEISGRDMKWFFDQVFYSSNVFDYGVAELASAPVAVRGYVDSGGQRTFDKGNTPDPKTFRTTVVVRRYGEAIFPVDIVVTFKSGETVRERWDGLDRWKMYTYDRPSQADSAVVDPERVLLLDVNYTNNSRTLAPRGHEAATKWMYKWMMWLEDLLVTYAFFV
jgi:hypothetical protein